MGVLTFAALSYVLRTIYRRLDKLGIFDVKPNEARRATAWIDALRGIAALGVVSSHLITCLAPFMFEACCSEPSSTWPSIFQLPPFRILAAGHSWLALFFVLSGFVSTLAPLQLAHSGRLDDAYSSIARASLKRPLRFVLPASIVTCISWLVCQLGGYVAARRVGQFLLSTNSPEQSEGLFKSFWDLGTALVNTWRWPGPENHYEGMQYALVWMLQGNYMIYGTLLATLGARKPVRVLIMAFVLCLSIGWSNRLVDPFVGPAYLSGALLAELWVSQTRNHLEKYSKFASPVLLVFAIVLMSWPKNKAEVVVWATLIKETLVDMMPHVLDPERLVGNIGAVLLIFAVMMSPRFRQSMNHPVLLWLGRISFAVYLLHMMVIRIVMPWLLYIGNPIKAFFLLGGATAEDAKSLLVAPSLFRRVFGVWILILLVLTVAHQWTRHVEPRTERIADSIEELATGVQKRPVEHDFATKRENGHGGIPMYHSSKPE